MEPGQQIAATRKSKGMTQEELAEKAAITVRTVQRIENGNSIPRGYTLKAIADALGIQPEILFPAAPALIPATVENNTTEALHFLQMLNLSCFSFLVLPVIHFLVPVFLLRQQKNNPLVLRTGRLIIQYQVCWVVATHLLLLITLVYNMVVAGKLQQPHLHISYLWTLFTMYLLNALIITLAALRLKKGNEDVYTAGFFKGMLRPGSR